MVIRTATREDVVKVAWLGQEHVREKTPLDPYDAELCHAKLLPYANFHEWDKQLFCAFVGERLVGYCVCEITGKFHNSDRVARMLLLYVVPENRVSRTAWRLLNAYVGWAMNLQCSEIWAGVEYEEGADRVFSLYKSFGFTKSGHLCKINL